MRAIIAPIKNWNINNKKDTQKKNINSSVTLLQRLYYWIKNNGEKAHLSHFKINLNSRPNTLIQKCQTTSTPYKVMLIVNWFWLLNRKYCLGTFSTTAAWFNQTRFACNRVHTTSSWPADIFLPFSQLVNPKLNIFCGLYALDSCLSIFYNKSK